MLAIILTVYWFAKKKYLLSLVCVITMILSQSRISLIALFLGILYFLLKNKQNKSLFSKFFTKEELNIRYRRFLSILLLAFFIFVSYFFSGINLDDRVMNYQNRLESTDNSWTAFLKSRELSNNAPEISTSAEYSYLAFVRPPNFALEFSATDISTARRFYIWNLVFKTTTSNLGLFIGMSPGFFGSAVDSNYIRIIGELGVIGMFLYFFWIRLMWKRGNVLFRSQIIMLCVTALYIDILVSLKVIVLIYLMAALQERQPKLKKTAKETD